ncbi:glucose ABC transporter substrate-binding protein GlcS [Ferroplasma acidiphilum]|jgi:glucose/arabinose transport system substrate-binding protein|uniref:glucose ABC transporter substrate-binding protein GlcS n=1 Tax=Ferroplasma acidiphilum TaxID=74969 RepID=UPI000038E631|nr:glucose ABC transporter substrate-binding protein GlcS [Ferroplasma acidiphilum]WMT53853.1 MAG: glucose ABC transporter substrate-binding protein GlcS [Ferroplasma acidiphilum]
MKNPNDEVKPPSKMKYVIIAIVVVIMVGAGVTLALYHPAKSKKVTFYTWWATEGKVAVDKEYAAFHAAYPNLTAVSELKAGAGGSAAKGEILTLIRDGDPPEAFQAHYGPGMLSYVEAASQHSKEFVNMTPILDSMTNVIPEVVEAGEYNGTSFSLPVDMHRGAELYINPNLLYNNSISQLPTNITELLSDSKTLNSALSSTGGGGWTIPGGDGGWDQMQVWEDFFLANSINTTGNATLYDELMYGTLNMHSSTAMKVINETNNDYLTAYGERMHGISTLTWTAVIHDITGSKSGFQANGNWYVNYAYDYLNVTAYPMNSSTINTAYDHSHHINLIAMPFPGTKGYFALIDDSVAIPTGPNQATGLTFAKYFSSFAGDKVFTKWKASSYYDNITSPSFYNTPSQWGDYECAVNDSGNSSRWVYQLSDGGMFASQTSSFETDLESLTSASSVSTWNSHLGSVISSEESSWLAGHNLSLGFLGTVSHPFGGYLPPWVHDPVNPGATAAQNTISTVNANNQSTAASSTSSPSIAIIVVGLTSIFLANAVIKKR